MADEQAQGYAAHHLAGPTLASLRRIETQLGKMMDTLSRDETRLGRVERDLADAEGDIVLPESRMLAQTNEILAIVQCIDDHQIRLDETISR